MIAIEVAKPDAKLFAAAKERHPEEVRIVESDKLDGSSVEILNVLVKLTPPVLATITTIVVALIRSRRHIRIKVGGIEVAGITESNAGEVLTKLLNR